MKMIYALALCALYFIPPASAQDVQSFSVWLQQFKHDAIEAGISQHTLDQAFEGTQPDERVVALDKKQPENKITLAQYLKNNITPKRIRDGKQFFAENEALLTRIGAAYGVQPRFIAALWGIETDFGRNTGNFVTTEALATLAYDGRRAAFFRNELLNALRILEAEKMTAEEMYGSWAGAVGQCQFMPSTYLKYAVDFNGDGKRDVWGDKGDAFASIANYLKGLGWHKEEGWGRPVKVPKGFDMTRADIKATKPLSVWQSMGIRKSDGSDLPVSQVQTSLITIGEGDAMATYVVYSNFKALLEWNRSRYFATSVGMLADAIAP